jgi:hypothetical protein
MPRGCSVHAGTRAPGNLLKFDEHRPANTDRWFGGVRRLNQAPKASLSHLWHDSTMKLILRLFATVHGVMAVLFACAALILIAIATREAWIATTSGLNRVTAQAIIEAVGLLAAAVVALQIAQTIAEEEVVRGAHISGPTRVRRFLSRFLVVITVAIAIEGLVATFKAVHEDLGQLVYAASILLSAGVLLAGWGIFIRMNRYAEELEPEAMKAAKSEDKKLK